MVYSKCSINNNNNDDDDDDDGNSLALTTGHYNVVVSTTREKCPFSPLVSYVALRSSFSTIFQVPLQRPGVVARS